MALGAGGPTALVEGISARYGLQAAESARMVAGNLTSEVTVLLFACSALLGILGLRLFRLQPGARIPAALFAVPGLAALPFGTLVNGAFIYTLLRARAPLVTSARYRQEVRRTPHLDYQSVPPSHLALLLAAFVVSTMVFMALTNLAFLQG